MQVIDSACFGKTDILLIAVCAHTLLTSPKNTTSSSALTGRLTPITISSLTRETDSTTPPSGSKKSRQIAGLEQSNEDRLDIDGAGEGVGDGGAKSVEPDQVLGLAKEDKIAESESNTWLLEGTSTGSKETGLKAKRFSSLSVKDKGEDRLSSVSDKELSNPDSDPEPIISSEISLIAKLSGPIGMTIGLTPAALNRKGTEKDRENSTVPDRSRWTVPAIPSESLKEKEIPVNNTKAESQKHCSKSKYKCNFSIIIFLFF